MRLLITGGAGFIGSHLSEAFLDRGHQVICVDNLITGSRTNLSHLRGRPGFTFIKKDVTRSRFPEEEVDGVLHLASPASPADYLRFPVQTLEAGSLGTRWALELARARGVPFLLASTSEVYGDPLIHPQGEDYWGNVNPIGPRGVYDEAKRFAEALTMAYHRTYSLVTKVCRIFNTYGPRMRWDDGRVIPTFITCALKGEPLPVFGDGSQTRSFCYISDLVAGLVCLWESDLQTPVNLGNPAEISVLELARKVLQLTHSDSPITFCSLPQDDPRLRKPDISRAREALGWQPEVGLEEGLRETIRWFQGILKENRSGVQGQG